MYLLHSPSNTKKAALIKKITAVELSQINNERFVFDWAAIEDGCELYRLSLIDEDEILGIMALKDYHEQRWIEAAFIKHPKNILLW